jgi:hypothetical protein
MAAMEMSYRSRHRRCSTAPIRRWRSAQHRCRKSTIVAIEVMRRRSRRGFTPRPWRRRQLVPWPRLWGRMRWHTGMRRRPRGGLRSSSMVSRKLDRLGKSASRDERSGGRLGKMTFAAHRARLGLESERRGGDLLVGHYPGAPSVCSRPTRNTRPHSWITYGFQFLCRSKR